MQVSLVANDNLSFCTCAVASWHSLMQDRVQVSDKGKHITLEILWMAFSLPPLGQSRSSH